MSITLKRQISDDEKALVLKQHGRKCFATGHMIPEGEPVQFDHIQAFSLGGPSETENIAPMCGQHNKGKGALPLGDYRVRLQLQEFFERGDKLTLRHLLEYLAARKDVTTFAQAVAVREESAQVVIESPTRCYTQALYSCPTTGWNYFYATLDVDVLDSDDDDADSTIGLQPRYLILEKVFDLFRHFQHHPVLQPSIGRIVNNRIRLFDGQHKVAALLWNGRRRFECKVYLSPDVRLLNQTNIAAHDKFAQTRFYSSIMVMKLGAQFGADFERYKNTEDDRAKSEAGFIEFLARMDGGPLTKSETTTRFRSYLYNAILEREDNRVQKLVSRSNRGTDEHPLTMDMLSKSLFACFLYREPASENMTTDSYLRDDEVQNVVAVLNMLYDQAFFGWDPKAPSTSETRRRLERLMTSKSMMAWAELLRDAVCGRLDLQDSQDRERPLYRRLSEAELKQIAKVVSRLVNWKRWTAPTGDEIDTVLAGNKSAVKEWFKAKGLHTGYLMGAGE